MTHSFPIRLSSDLFEKEKQAMESLSADETAKWVRYHLPREEQWFKVDEHILENDKPDLMAVMFDGTDKIQHQAWPWLDKNLLTKNPQGHDKEMREVCLESFKQLDGSIERMVKSGRETCGERGGKNGE